MLPKLKNQFTFIVEILEIVIIIFALSWFAKTYLVQFVIIDDDSMLPTFTQNNRLFVQKIFFQLKRGNIIVYESPDKNQINIKRIIGLPGEQIEIRNGLTYVNNEPIYEPYAPEIPVSYEFKPVMIPKRHIFVLNDNRYLKNDSRMIGCIPYERVKGKVILCYWPLTKIKILI